MEDRPVIQVKCTECQFSKIVYPDDTEAPHEVILQHGRRNGHKLKTTNLDEDQDLLSP